MLREVEPSLQSSAVYILDAKEFDPLERPSDVLAWTGFLCDLQVSDALRERGQWQGEGFAAIVYFDRILNSQRHLAGLVLHELAHWLTFPKRSSPYSELDAATATEWVAAATDAADAATNDDPPWMRHEPPFVRAACHLAYRTMKRFDISPHYLSFSQTYYDVGEWVWMRTLASELPAMEHASIRDILQTEPPAEFSDLARILMGWWDSCSRFDSPGLEMG